MAWICPGCDAKNKPRAVECEHCGTERPAGATPKGQLPLVCWYDGGRLDAQGYCSTGEGFPVGVLCPFFCPICQHRLQWSGACHACHGSSTASDHTTWTFPGARHETHDVTGTPIGDGQHYVEMTARGRRGCTAEENRAGFADVQRILTILTLQVQAAVRL